MTFQPYKDIGFGLIRIDTGMVRDELAACYLMSGVADAEAWHRDEALREADHAIIETGTHNTVPAILRLLDQRGIDRSQVRYVIPTHVHLDHAGGVGGLMQALPEATLLVHPRGARHMIDPSRLKAGATEVYGEAAFAEIYGDVLPVDERRVRTMNDGEQVRVGDRQLVFYDTPGHARHHFCVYDPASAGIFTGDTFGLSYPQLTTAKGPFILPTTTPVQFDPPALRSSIERLLSLSPERVYLTHYDRVDNPMPLGEALLRRLADFVELADTVDARRDASCSEPGELEAALQSAMTHYVDQELEDHGLSLSEDRRQALLGMDIRLNCQGLAVWLQSRRS